MAATVCLERHEKLILDSKREYTSTRPYLGCTVVRIALKAPTGVCTIVTVRTKFRSAPEISRTAAKSDLKH